MRAASTPVVVSCVTGFLAGVGIGSVTNTESMLSVFLVFLALVLFSLGRVYGYTSVFLVTLFLFSVSLGIFRFEVADTPPPLVTEKHIGEQVTFTGTVDRDVDKRDIHAYVVLKINSIKDTSITNEVRVRATIDRFTGLSYGDRVRVTGLLETPEPFKTDTGRMFAYDSYLRKDNVFYVMYDPDMTIVDRGNGNWIASVMIDVKRAFLARIQDVLPEPHSSLAAGITLGVKQSLGEELLESFRETGIVHIVVLSGYNVTLVAEAIVRLFGFVSAGTQFIFGGVGIVLFAIMVGGGATVIRASLMAIIALLARTTGRIGDAGRALALAATAMVAWNPFVLVHDPSFQLSFVATLGLIYISPLIESRLTWITNRWGVRSIVGATLGTQLSVLPLLLFYIGELSLVSVPVNILVLISVPLAMFAVFATGLVGIISTALSVPLGFVAYGVLAYELFIVDVFARIPFASVGVPQVSVWMVLSLYLMIGAMVVWVYHRGQGVRSPLHYLNTEQRKTSVQE